MSIHIIDTLSTVMPLLAQAATGPPSPSLCWGIVLFFTILGLLVTLSPPRRTSEVKKQKND